MRNAKPTKPAKGKIGLDNNSFACFAGFAFQDHG